MATGVNEDGKQTSSTELIGQVVQQIKNNKTLTKLELLRLAALVLTCIKLSKQDYQDIIGLFDGDSKRVLTNLVALGVSYDKNISKSTKNIDKAAMDLSLIHI